MGLLVYLFIYFVGVLEDDEDDDDEIHVGEDCGGGGNVRYIP